MKILVVVDVQKDFVDGSLGTAEAVQMIPNAVDEIQNPSYDRIFVTLDTHETDYLNTMEGKYLPVEHCIRGTDGWKLNADIAKALEDKRFKIIEKPTFGSYALVQEVTAIGTDEIVLIGLCTDICVISNALLLRAALPNTKISVRENACAGVTKEKHDAAIEVLKSNQVEVF